MVMTLEKPPEPKHPGVRLAQLIKDRGKTDSWLADEAALSRPLLSQITNGNRRITPRTARKICDVLGGDPIDWVKQQRAYDLFLETSQFNDETDSSEED